MRSEHGRLRRIVGTAGRSLVLVASVVIGAVAAFPVPSPAVDTDSAFVVTIDSPTVKLGERGVIVATITAGEGFKITESYRHKIRKLSALDDGVRLASKVVNGAMQEGKVVFLIDVVPTKVGTHSVVGFFRFSVHNGQQLDIKSAPFEAAVTATE
jgi:hypothetical protein